LTSRFVMFTAVAAISMMQALSAEPPSAPGGIVSIAFSFNGSRSDDAVAGMESEMAILLTGTNVHLQWFERQKDSGLYVDGRILVVNIRGDCQTTERGRLESGEALAWNDVTDGHFQPFVTVDCARVARFVARELRGSDRQETDRLVGRAIARVIAHEMYHFFTRTKRHSRSSVLFRAALQPQDLVSEGVRFETEEIEKLEQGIEKPADCED